MLACTPGYLPNMLDIAPRFAGVVMGTADAVATATVLIIHTVFMQASYPHALVRIMYPSKLKHR